MIACSLHGSSLQGKASLKRCGLKVEFNMSLPENDREFNYVSGFNVTGRFVPRGSFSFF